ncbi:LAETG motif-containing sortase-dependent surface protein [Kitasatospora sp. CM 4170]|uniref:LAETG motif-containing sortase-dependent surface protein n=1 Tax=Kitasatospora aburaviensis TaxID=67265 RepID=A0ABW1EZD7_9ACTN|nr:LAETG motif-containing sortase-dependent surface protein [Kitasatospora sp. CM 4170]WNM47020.1 LAETG motif-containing sortase-dependent surface protein [Kitasatospora sp. CM 4170]
MRTSRLLAASSLLALSLGATVGTATAGAAAVSPTPTATSSATATPSGTPSATPSATGSASPSASATAKPTTASPSASASATTAKPTVRPTVPVPSPSVGGNCPGGFRETEIKATGSGLAGTTLVKGGPAQELSVTFENTSPVDLEKFNAFLFATDIAEEGAAAPTTSIKEAFTVEAKLPGADWKAVEQSNPSYMLVNLGDFKIAKGAKLTLQVRIKATGKARSADYFAELRGTSETIPSKNVPGSTLTNGCHEYFGDHRVDDLFKVSDAAPSTTAKASASTSPAAGPHLAETGSSSNTLPIAVGGAAVLAAGAGTLVVLRRRKAGSHS